MPNSFLNNVIINRPLALLRIDNFLDKKEIIDEEFMIDHPLVDRYNYKPAEFKSLLNILVKGAYTGLRVYFASSNESKDMITLVYAPTKEVDSVNEDAGAYFIFSEGKYLESIQASDARAWVANYNEKILPVLQQAGFYETKCIFYKIDIISKLFNYIIENGPLKSAKIHFCAYLDKDDPNIALFENSKIPIDDAINSNKLTLVFGLRGPNIGKDKKKGIQKINNMLVILSGAFGDTGNPCPPPDDKPCPGAKLLQ